MRAYLAISAQRGEAGAAALSEAAAAARRLAPEALPYPAASGRSSEWVAPGGSTALLGWSNEPDHPLVPLLIERSGPHAIGFTGYLNDRSGARALLQAEDLGGVVDRTGGCFGVFRCGPDGFAAATTITRVDPVYIAAASGLQLAGSRALLVHLVAEAVESGREHPDPAYDLLALHSIVRHGFFVSDATPFRGVTALPPASTRTSTGASARIARRPEPMPPRGRRDIVPADVDQLAAAIREAVEPIRRHPEPPELALSGGRDSRLVAAALHAAGITFHAATHAFDDDPDAIVARLVASSLGLARHRVWADRVDPDRHAVVVEHPVERAYRAAWIGEGMNSASDVLSSSGDRFRVVPKLSGSGGEILRGGYLYDQPSVARRAMRQRIERLFTSGSQFLVPEANELARAALTAWDARAPDEGAESLAALYLYYRVGRWLVGPRTSTLLNSTYYHPLLDNLVVRRAVTVPALARWNERAVHALVTRLAPTLRDVPLEGRRWRYEERRPRSLRELPAWLRRGPIAAAGPTSGFDWRRQHDARFVALLREAIMDGPSVLFDLVRREAVAPLFMTVPVTNVPVVWRLLALSALLSNRWRRGEWPSLPKVDVPIPGPPA